MKTKRQIINELNERFVTNVKNVEVYHFEGMSNDIRLKVDGCMDIATLIIIQGYFGGTAYVHNDKNNLIITINDINGQSEGL